MADDLYYYARIAYNANGGSGAPSAQTKSTTTSGGFCIFTLSSSTPSRTYFNFKGWSTSSSATSASYSAGGTCKAAASTQLGAYRTTTLYAVWQHQIAYVYYNANGGENAPDTQSHYRGYSVTLTEDVPTRDGYNFLGWSQDASATTADYQPNTSYPLYNTVTLYAVWELATINYTITFNANGGSGSVPSTLTGSVVPPSTITLPSTPKPTRTYYVFNGWSTSSSASTGSYSVEISGDSDVSITEYATWSKDTAYVYYNANGGSGEPSTQSHEAGTAITLSATVPTRSGYQFLGWATSASATTASYQPSTSYNLYTTTTLYAVWADNRATISTGNGTLGTAQTVTINNYDSNTYTVTITYSFGSASGTIVTKTSSGSVSWTPPTSLAQQIPNAKTGSCTLTATTYNGNTSQGTTTLTITLTVPQSLAPTVSVSIYDNNSTARGWGIYVQSRSYLTFTVTATAQQGASISTYSESVNGSSYSSATFTTGVLLYSGSNSYSVTVTDSRGLSKTVTGTLSVVAYSNPSLTLTLCDRDDSTATTANIQFDYSIASASSHNNKQYAIDYKLSSASSWTTGTATTLSSYSGTKSATLTGLDTGEEYNIRVRLIDSFTSVSVASEIGSSGNIIVNSRHQGGVGIGIKSQAANRIDLGNDTVVHGTITVGSTTLTEAQLISLLNLL